MNDLIAYFHILFRLDFMTSLSKGKKKSITN